MTDIASIPGYFPDYSRDKTQEVLKNQQVGTYLIRYSNNTQSYVLSVVQPDSQIFHVSGIIENPSTGEVSVRGQPEIFSNAQLWIRKMMDDGLIDIPFSEDAQYFNINTALEAARNQTSSERQLSTRDDMVQCDNPICLNRGNFNCCAGCKKAKLFIYYCSVDCQRECWPTHKNYCGITQDPTGKSAKASQTLANSKGNSQSTDSVRCHNEECQKIGNLTCCAACKSVNIFVYYCSADCQRVCWPRHQLYCGKSVEPSPSEYKHTPGRVPGGPQPQQSSQHVNDNASVLSEDEQEPEELQVKKPKKKRRGCIIS